MFHVTGRWQVAACCFGAGDAEPGGGVGEMARVSVDRYAIIPFEPIRNGRSSRCSSMSFDRRKANGRETQSNKKK